MLTNSEGSEVTLPWPDKWATEEDSCNKSRYFVGDWGHFSIFPPHPTLQSLSASPQWLWQLWANVGIWMSAAWWKCCQMRQRKNILLVESAEHEICGQKSLRNVPDISTTWHTYIYTHAQKHLYKSMRNMFKLHLNIFCLQCTYTHTTLCVKFQSCSQDPEAMPAVLAVTVIYLGFSFSTKFSAALPCRLNTPAGGKSIHNILTLTC